jgi:hypothetical protein
MARGVTGCEHKCEVVTGVTRKGPGALPSELVLHVLSVWDHLGGVEDAGGLEVSSPLLVVPHIIPGRRRTGSVGEEGATAINIRKDTAKGSVCVAAA